MLTIDLNLYLKNSCNIERLAFKYVFTGHLYMYYIIFFKSTDYKNVYINVVFINV